MSIPQYIVDRITQAQLSGPRVSELLGSLSAGVDQLGMPGGTFTLEFVGEGDPLQAGDLIPIIQLTVRRLRQADVEQPAVERIGGI